MLIDVCELMRLREVWGWDGVEEVEALGDSWPAGTALLPPDTGAEVAIAPSVSTSYCMGCEEN